LSGKKLKIMVSSTVYGSGSDLDQIRDILNGFDYEVVMSREGNIYVPIGDDTVTACLKAVEDCDLFLGIIFPRYGSGITHLEFQKAIELNKPRWFVAHQFIEYTRKLMEQYMYSKNGSRNKFDIKPTVVLDSLKVIDMYNLVRGDWVQSFYRTSEIQVFIETQFKDQERRIKELRKRCNP
jgi:hypothetical protein